MDVRAAWKALWNGPQIECVEVRVPGTLTTIYGADRWPQEFYLTPDRAMQGVKFGAVCRYTAFQSRDAWYAVGRRGSLSRIEVRE